MISPCKGSSDFFVSDGMIFPDVCSSFLPEGLTRIISFPIIQKAIDYRILVLKTNVVDGKNREQAVMTMENIHNFKKRYIDKNIY